MSDPKAPILVVEDSPEDFEVISVCLQRAGARNDLMHFNDGQELFQFLQNYRSRRSVHQPAVILLDLNLPGLSGHAVLSELRKDESLGLVPVVVLSTSSAPSDVNLAYRNGANSYLVKPVTLNSFETLMENFTSYWLESSVPPIPSARRN